MSAIFTITRDQVITAAYQLCQVYGNGESANANDISDALPFLQSLLKLWDKEGYNSWLYSTINWPSVAAQASYTMANPGGQVLTDRPVRIPQAWTQDANGNRTPLVYMTRQQFELFTPPNAVGPPNSYMYDRQILAGIFKPWPIPSDTSLTFYAVVQRPISDIGATGGSTFDVEQEWYIPLIWGLAEQIMGMCGTEEQQCRRIEKNAEKYLMAASDFTQEDGSIYLQPSPQGGPRGRG